MKENEIERLKGMNQQLLLLLGYATGSMFALEKFMSSEDKEKFKWLKNAVENVVYLDKPLPEMP
jgi:hypothetical protein